MISMTPKSVLIPVTFVPPLVNVNVLPIPVNCPEISSRIALPE